MFKSIVDWVAIILIAGTIFFSMGSSLKWVKRETVTKVYHGLTQLRPFTKILTGGKVMKW